MFLFTIHRCGWCCTCILWWHLSLFRSHFPSPFSFSLCRSAPSVHIHFTWHILCGCVLCKISRMFVDTEMSSNSGLNRPRSLSLSELRKTKQRATACNRNDKKKKNTEKQQQQQRKRFAIKTETKSIWHRLFIACLSLSVSLPGYPLPHRLMFLKRCTDSFAFSRGF